MGVKLADAGSWTAAAAPGLEIAFVDEAGAERHGPFAQLWHVGFESADPVRVFPSYRGQRSFSGWWWCATTARPVGFESWLERDHLMLLDRDPRVVGIASQPFVLSWSVEGRRRKHVPDYFARLADGSGVVVDVRPDTRIEPRDAAAFAATAEACEMVGWQYRRVGELAPVLLSNIRWLAAYRHPRCRDTVIADTLLAVFTEPRPLARGVAAVGDRLRVLPTLFHLLWTGALTAELDQAALHGATAVSVAGCSP